MLLLLNVANSHFLFFAEGFEENTPYYRLRNPFAGTLVFNLQIETNVYGNSRITGLWIPLIRNETSRHYVILKNISPSPSEIKIDDYGNTYAYWNENSLPKQRYYTVSVNYQILSFETSYIIDANSVVPYDKNSTIYKSFTQPEQFIESDNAIINSTAYAITEGETNPHEIAYKIYQYVIDTLKYEAQSEEHGALWALQHKKGDCSEFSYLFVALCRAAGIPAKIKVGYAFQRDTQSEENGHMWAEYYLENYGWIPVDPTWHLFDKIDQRHFDTLQSKPSLLGYTSYANYLITFSGPPPNSKLTAQINQNPEFLQNFAYGKALYDAVLEIQKTDFAFTLVKLLGAPILFSSEFNALNQARNNADLYIKGAENNWLLSSDTNYYLQQAKEKAEQAYTLARNILLKIVISILTFLLILSIIVTIIIMKRHKKEPMEESYEYSQTTTFNEAYLREIIYIKLGSYRL
jgi:transglutaminase-like putative cysteine protease